jgi:Pyridoxamine 5'-phosphate oxidase
MPIALTAEIKEMVNGGLTSGNPMMLAVVSGNKPVLSFRGSTQVYSDSALGLWIRAGSGNTLDAIKANPNVAMMYRSATTPFLQFQGRARIATDEAERKKVFENSPEFEQSRDTERTGTAVIIELESVTGVLRFGANGPELVKLEK